CPAVLLVGHVLTPGHGAPALVRAMDRDMRHEPRGRSAVPVVLARLEDDPVTRPDHLDRSALALAEADAFGDPDRLTVRVGVPGGPRARREVDTGRAERPALRRRGDRVDVHRAGEPVTRALARLENVPCDLHGPRLPDCQWATTTLSTTRIPPRARF